MSANSRGFTLIEVLIATLLLVTALVGSVALVLSLRSVNLTTRSRDTAYYLAQQALDTLEAVPLAPPLPNVGFLVAGAVKAPAAGDPPLLGNMFVPTTQTCYPMSDDTITDRPVACAGNTAPAYILRTWTCCDVAANVAGLGAIAGVPAQVINNACGPQAAAGTLGTPNTGASGVVCFIQAEVTWPVELAAESAAPNILFVDVDPAVPSKFGFLNHVYLSSLRAL